MEKMMNLLKSTLAVGCIGILYSVGTLAASSDVQAAKAKTEQTAKSKECSVQDTG
jgi:hypothetical protein